MLAPLSWLKEYVDITVKPDELAERLTEIGLGTEKIETTKDDVIFDFEITPNRPDLLSIIGIAREIAAIEQKKMKSHMGGVIGKPKKILPLEIKTDSKINPRFTGIIIDGIKVKESPTWLKERLTKIGQRPINNIVDITNYVMFELGNPLHAFDYDRIEGKTMIVHQAKGGEQFKSVDGLNYHLPKGAVVISDEKKIIDLCGIKGGFNSGTFEDTKTIFIRVPVEDPILIRRASQSLGLRSEASSIFERGVNRGGTIEALNRCVNLILELAGGEIASEVYDIKKEEFKPWKLSLRIELLNKILGIEISQKRVLEILENLNLSPKIVKNNIGATIPTYRNDLKIEEDLIEEVARIYGYNKFPKTMPQSGIPTLRIPYFKDFELEKKAKEIFKASGFSEIYTYSLISEKDLKDNGFNEERSLRVDNPVSREFEYLRPSLKINLRKAFAENKANFEKVNLFELGKVYLGKNLDEKEEPYYFSGITNEKNYAQVKGEIERLFWEFGIKEDPSNLIEVDENGIIFEFNLTDLLKKTDLEKIYKPLPKYPPVIEDLAIVADEKIKTGDLISEIKKQSSLISEVSLLDIYGKTRTFHIIYQHKERNLTTGEVSKIREKILSALKEKFHATLKE